MTVALRLSILGSTGSIGRSALDVVRHYPDMFDVVALGAYANVELLARQILEFRPSHVAIADEAAAARFQPPDVPVEVHTGSGALDAIASIPVDAALCAVVGAAGLKPVLRAIDAGNRIALANKEPLVIAGPLIMQAAHTKGVQVLPVDSEHNAIFQCLEGHSSNDVHCIHLTASGGPFYGKPTEVRLNVTPEEAANHPTWDMGKKISVDSATLMNKGLEVIEARWLFALQPEAIQVVLHPQSVVHSMVAYADGSVLAQLGNPDMRTPIAHALAWPRRMASGVNPLDLFAVGRLDFTPPPPERFPCLDLAYDALASGGTATTILNAANEVAVQAFLDCRIGFPTIAQGIAATLDAVSSGPADSLEGILAADAEARDYASQWVDRHGHRP